jgi:nitrate reductase NapE component
MKNSILLIASFLFMFISSFCQTSVKKVDFYGFSIYMYQHSVDFGNGQWEPYHKNLGDIRQVGQIIIDDTKKNIKIVFVNGNESGINNFTKETIKETIDFYGEVEKIIYKGIGSSGFDAKLQITITQNNGCITKGFSKKVIDDEKGIDCYQKIITYATSGKCFE